MDTSYNHTNLKDSVKIYQEAGYSIFKFFGEIDINAIKWTEKKILELVAGQNINHLVLMFDLSQYTSMTFNAREKANQSILLKSTKLDLVIWGLDPSKKASLQFLFSNNKALNIYQYDSINGAKNKAVKLVNEIKMGNLSWMPSAITGFVRDKIVIKNRELDYLHDKNWTYNAPNGQYFYKIDLIDSNILVSKPAGVIEYENSINANVLFDKVVYELLGHNKSYYRIQDYTEVEKTSYSARRDFTNYIIKNIDRIDLMIFYGLNPGMKAVVRIGKLVHPGFSKVKIADTREEALEMILAHKYGDSVFDEEIEKIATSNKNDLISLQQHKAELNNIFDEIGKILWAPNSLRKYEKSDSLYDDIYQALDVLKSDIDEILAKKDRSIEQMHKQLFEFSEEIKKYRQEIRDINLNRIQFLKTVHYDIRTPLQSILSISELIQLNKNEQEKADYIQLLLESSRELSIKMSNQTERLQKKISSNSVNSSVFNLNNYISNQLSVYKSIADDANLNLIYNAGVIEEYYIGDIEKIANILDHLIMNAIQNSSDSDLVIETELLNHYITRQEIRISVRDYGYGLRLNEKELVRKIFNGNPIESNALFNHHFGNGLIICQGLAGLLGGKMIYEDLEEGSQFSFEITLDLGVFSRELNLLKRSLSLRFIQSMSNEDIKVLIWTDKQNSVESDLLVFKQLEVRSDVLTSESEVYDIVETKSVDLVLVHYEDRADIEKKSGLLREKSLNKDISICGITTNLDVNIDGLFESKLLDFHLLKPYSIKNLVDVLKDSIKKGKK